MSEAASPKADNPTIESVLQEQRVFEPPASLAATARINSMAAYRDLAVRAESDPDGFWGEMARQHLQMATGPTKRPRPPPSMPLLGSARAAA